MRILIIGGTGIISTGITRLLIERGDDVIRDVICESAGAAIVIRGPSESYKEQALRAGRHIITLEVKE